MLKLNSPTREEIVAARKDAHLSQEDVARMLGVALRTYQTWESGARSMRSMWWELMQLKIKDL